MKAFGDGDIIGVWFFQMLAAGVALTIEKEPNGWTTIELVRDGVCLLGTTSKMSEETQFSHVRCFIAAWRTAADEGKSVAEVYHGGLVMIGRADVWFGNERPSVH